MQSLTIAEAYGLIGDVKRAERISQCGTWLEFAQCPQGHRKKLLNARFCRERWCAMCNSRRALLVAGQVRDVCHTALQGLPTLRFVFLTLTIPSVGPDELGGAVTGLYEAFKKLIRVKEVKTILKGYFRALEVTYNRERGDYHPHLHVLMAVPPSYFAKSYISHSRWLELWQRATGNDAITQVDIRKVTPKKKGGSLVAGAASEVAKYAVKSDDIIQDSPEETALVLEQIHTALRGRKLVQFGLLLSQIQRELKLPDAESATSEELVEVGTESTCTCPVCGSNLVPQIYHWLGGKEGEYIA